MGKEFDVIIERDEDGWLIGTVLALRGCRTQARSLDELMARVAEAIALCLEIDGEPTSKLNFVGVHRVRIA